jgi:PAS domain S-box-containing protein
LPGPDASAEELYQNAPCGYVTTRPDGTIVRVNRTLLRWTGYDGRALEGRRFQDLLTVAGRIYYETHFAPLLRMQGEVHEVAFDLQLEDGSRLPVLTNSVLRLDGDGTPVSVLTTLIEVTERRRYERELLLARRRAEQLAEVVNASGDAILLMAPDGTIQGWNRGAERLFGYPAAEAVGRSARDLLVPPDRLEEYDRTTAEAGAGRESRLETVRVARDGRRVDVSLTLTPHVEALGEVVAVSSIIRDVSERRRMEAELRQAEQLRALATLAGGVAHEINNQMTVVLGLGAFVRQALGEEHAQTPDVEEMVAAGRRAAEVTRQLLAFGRRQLMQPQEVDLAGLASGLAPALARLIGEDKHLALERDDEVSPVRGDSAQLEQMLLQLAANARDAMGPGGLLTIAIRDTTLTEEDADRHPADDVMPGPYVLLSVADTGRGMDPATLARVFEPFFTTKTVGEGAGLGLSTVYGIVKQHGGQIWARSEPGAGTTIRVYLPAVAEAAILPPAESPATARNGAVLLVEDDAAVRGLARRTLEAAGIEVMEAENGRRAWALLTEAATPPALVLADLMMPDTRGGQLGDAIGRHWADVPVLYTSDYAASDVEARGLLPPGAPFLQKPFTPDELVLLVRELLARAQADAGA